MRRVSVLGRGAAVTLSALFALLLAAALPAIAQAPAADPAMKDLSMEQAQRGVNQPGNNAPVWREVRGGDKEAYASIPGREVNVLVQTEGQEWRARRNGFWSIVAGWSLVGLVIILAIAHMLLGTTHLREPETGRKIQRFTNFERWVHWSAAISFVVLATTGLIMLFGKNILLPIIGYTLFSWLAELGKILHNFLGPLFVVTIAVMIVTFVRDNIPKGYDFKWLFSLGGLIGGGHPPSGKFNGGEKIWFWGGALVMGLTVGVSGLVLDFPNFDQTRSTMQLANIVHLIATTLFMLGTMGHIYLGTLGVAGAYDGMRTGLVDETWAKEHHPYWYEDVKSGKVTAEVVDTHAATRQPASGPAD
ncbi:MAG: formate dehydrogenase subunit gamma [Betaproteobacteria bacterium]|nr:formate dehydrogenase subunit gamma [Betaproteobacteria bacterium]